MPNAIQKLQDMSSYSNLAGEAIDWTYYDTAEMDAAVLVHRFFTASLGQQKTGGGQKTLADTNLTSAGALPQGQAFRVHLLKVGYVTSAAKATADLNLFYNLLNNTTVELVVPGKDSLGTYRLMELCGITIAFALTPTVAGDNIAQMQPTFIGKFKLNIPWDIGATQSFELKVQHHVPVPASLEDDKLILGLNGELKRLS